MSLVSLFKVRCLGNICNRHAPLTLTVDDDDTGIEGEGIFFADSVIGTAFDEDALGVGCAG